MTGRIPFSNSSFRIGLRAGHSWLLCYSTLVSRFPRFSLHHLLCFRLLLCQHFSQDPLFPSVGLSPLRPVTLAFTSPVLSSVCPQPPVPPASAVTTTVVAVSVTTSVSAASAARPQSESVPAPASTADPGSETDSDPPLVFALLPRPRPDAPPSPPPASDV
jgi:hypothetical protein